MSPIASVLGGHPLSVPPERQVIIGGEQLIAEMAGEVGNDVVGGDTAAEQTHVRRVGDRRPPSMGMLVPVM